MSRKIVGITVGTPTSPERIAEEILPAVTDKDEGKILQVEGGKWAKNPLPPCDEELSDTSEKPVQNKVVKAALDKKIGRLNLAKNSDIDKMFK